MAETWISVYDGITVTDAGKPDIDHMVPLANAWRSGAGSWTAERRKAFANDLPRPQLLAVSAATNRSKGDQGPDEWQPPAKGYWCTYATAWTNVKSTYQLTVTGGGEDEAGRDAGDVLMTDHHLPDSTPQPECGLVPDGSVPLTDHVKAGPGGVMTDEVGVITGEVTLATEADPDGTASVSIQYRRQTSRSATRGPRSLSVTDRR